MSPESPSALTRRARLGLSTYYFCMFGAIGFSTPFLPLHWRSLHLSYLEIGVLLALSSGAGAAMLIPAGILSDRVGRRHPFVVTGCAAAAACFLAYPSLTRFGQLALVQPCLGIGVGVSLSAASALGADLFHRASTGRSFARVRSWGTVGFLSTLGAVYLWPALGREGRFFPLAGALYGLAAATILLVPSAPRAGSVAPATVAAARGLLRQPGMAAFVAAYLLGNLALSTGTANLSLYLTAFGPRGQALVPLAYAISAACELPFLMGMGWAADRFGRVLPLRVCCAVLPLRLVLYAVAPVPEWTLLLQATHGLTFSVLAVVPFAYMADRTPAHLKATGQAILNAAAALATTAGPLAGGRVADAAGIRGLYWMLAGSATLGALLLYAFVREPCRASAVET